MSYTWRPYVSVAQRRKKTAAAMARLKQKGQVVSPVLIQGRAIAHTVWGRAWCANLERYGDYSNRLPRGRTYVRNGSVVDLQMDPGRVTARVSGSSSYRVTVTVAAMSADRWTALSRECSGGIDSLVELLQGRVSTHVLELMCRAESGLFPSPSELRFECTCPDWASMCKHVAAALYGVGSRLDTQPELLFRLRKVDERELIAHASRGAALATARPRTEKLLDATLVSEVFGIDLAESAAAKGKQVRKREKPRRRVR